MKRPRLLDLFGGCGGCAKGYHQAGFDVVSVDKKSFPRHPGFGLFALEGMSFVQADALEYLEAHWREFDAIAASPPCQAHSALRHMPFAKEHPDLIPQTRALLQMTGLPYVIENVPGAPLVAAVILCGTMFGLKTAWLLVELTTRHEAMEAFQYQGKRVFDPHKTIAELIGVKP